ncbi:unnamed protein product [Parnassius apollo]|uniref:(apollo) hypothetical protein n=1 Tax=Parnassius apollo TaxID=110799 RepID=A0A8S3XV32_PARAO|nr:unnamed protein product [Parnassius apollo]
MLKVYIGMVNCTLLLALKMQVVCSMSLLNKHSYFMDNSGSETEVADLISEKSYVPNERDLPKTTLVKNIDNDATYILSKLSDEQLIKLLNEQPGKSEYYLSDIVKLTNWNAPKMENRINSDVGQGKPNDILLNNQFDTQNPQLEKRFRTVVAEKDKAQPAFFRLENKEIDPFHEKNEANYAALQKLNSLLYSYPQTQSDDMSEEEDDERKELLFDVLVSQLKTLCCKKSVKKRKKHQYKYLNQFVPKVPVSKPLATDSKSPQFQNEYMFLILNEEIRSNGSDELISVDPESLEKNSSVLLLGPITTPLSDNQLSIVMARISNELSKPEYIPLLQQLSAGAISNTDTTLLRSVINGPQTRRYIKPHRCNHQSKLAKIYGGPKWLICTGYLNLNTPSLYD